MRYAVRHETRFTYPGPVRFARCNVRLKPIAWSGQHLIDHALTVTPGGTTHWARADASLANVDRLIVTETVTALSIVSCATIDVERAVPMPAATDPSIADVRALAAASRDITASSPANYLFPSPMIALDAEIAEWCAPSLSPERGVLDALIELARRIQEEFAYDTAVTITDTPPLQAFRGRHGVCQDFAQVMIAGLRGHSLPAAYVSGYIRTYPPEGEPRLIGADATHAWVLVWAGPELGWVGVDPTNGIWMAGDHIVLAIGRDYSEVAPVDGIFLGQSAQSMTVSVDVAPLNEAETALSAAHGG